MEHHALLHRSVEVQIVEDRDVDEIVGREAAVVRVLQVIGGVVVARLARGRVIEAGRRVVAPVGQELEHEEGVGRAALAKVHFDGVVAPLLAVADRNEVHAETAQNAFLAQGLRCLEALGLNLQAIALVSRKATAEEDLIRLPTHDLIVG